MNNKKKIALLLILVSFLSSLNARNYLYNNDSTIVDIGRVGASQEIEIPKEYVYNEPSYDQVENQTIYSERMQSEKFDCETDFLGTDTCSIGRETCDSIDEYTNGSSQEHTSSIIDYAEMEGSAATPAIEVWNCRAYIDAGGDDGINGKGYTDIVSPGESSYTAQYKTTYWNTNLIKFGDGCVASFDYQEAYKPPKQNIQYTPKTATLNPGQNTTVTAVATNNPTPSNYRTNVYFNNLSTKTTYCEDGSEPVDGMCGVIKVENNIAWTWDDESACYHPTLTSQIPSSYWYYNPPVRTASTKYFPNSVQVWTDTLSYGTWRSCSVTATETSTNKTPFYISKGEIAGTETRFGFNSCGANIEGVEWREGGCGVPSSYGFTTSKTLTQYTYIESESCPNGYESTGLSGTQACKRTTPYTYYDYMCPADLNDYNMSYIITDPGGDCLPTYTSQLLDTNNDGIGDSCNLSAPPTNNCYRVKYTCPVDSNLKCGQTRIEGVLCPDGTELVNNRCERIQPYCDDLYYEPTRDVCQERTTYSKLCPNPEEVYNLQTNLCESPNKGCIKGEYNSQLNRCVMDFLPTCNEPGYVYNPSSDACENPNQPVCEIQYGINNETMLCKGEMVMCELGKRYNEVTNKCEVDVCGYLNTFDNGTQCETQMLCIGELTADGKCIPNEIQQ